MAETEFKFEYDEAPLTEKQPNLEYDFQELSIAGVNYHAKSDKSWGIITGYTQREPKNEYNPNAVKIVKLPIKRKIGYVSEDDLEDFNEWNKGRKYPFVGYIAPFKTSEGETMNLGKVYVIKPFEGEDDKTAEALQHFAKIANEGYKQAISDYSGSSNNGGCLPMVLLIVLLGLAMV